MQVLYELHSLLAILLLLITGHAAPILENTTDNAEPPVPNLRHRGVIQSVVADENHTYQTCLPFNDEHMCTVSFLEYSTWQAANIYLYDHTCNSLETYYQIPRQMLAAVMVSGYGYPVRSDIKSLVYV